MSKVFLSYNFKDSDVADEIINSLKSAGVDVFSDRSILAGANLDSTMSVALREADAVVILLSRNSANSKWLRAEVASALDHKKKVIPVLLDSESKENWIWPLVSTHQAISFEDNKTYVEDIISKIVKNSDVASFGATPVSSTIIEARDVPLDSEISLPNKSQKLGFFIKLALVLVVFISLCFITFIMLYSAAPSIRNNASCSNFSSDGGRVTISCDVDRVYVDGNGNIVITPKKEDDSAVGVRH